eukprot:1584952-Rhodomonas_salina.1
MGNPSRRHAVLGGAGTVGRLPSAVGGQPGGGEGTADTATVTPCAVPGLPNVRVGAAPPALCSLSVLPINGGGGRGTAPHLSLGVPNASSDPHTVLFHSPHSPSPHKP